MSEGYAVVSLAGGGEIDPSAHLSAGWRSIRVWRLEAGATGELPGPGLEHALFVLDGAGSASVGADVVRLASGSALTLPVGSGASIVAEPGGLELFVMTLWAKDPGESR